MKAENFQKDRHNDERSEIEEGLEDWFAERGGLSKTESTEKLPLGMRTLADVQKELAAAGMTPGDTYRWYSEAMVRRDREPLSEESFIRHFFGENSTDVPVAFGDPEKGYAFGFMRSGVFIPSHFAPRSLRKGYELFSDLGKGEHVPAVLAITPDLVNTLRKMPSWHELDVPLTGVFRGTLQQKRLMYNDHPEVMERMRTIFAEMMTESRAHENGDHYSAAA